MAEYHLNAKFFTRSKGHSAVAAAAYRAGERLRDERTHLTHDYSRKTGIEATEILIPEEAADWMRDRSQLWNGVEKAEKRKDSQLCLEFDIALPVELSRHDQKEALRNFAHEQFVARGYVVDIAYHTMDTHNPHAHVMVPLRPVEAGKFAKKPNRWGSYNQDLRGWREAWARHANILLEQNGQQARIDHRTLQERGIDRTPQIHIGKSAWHAQKTGREFDRWTSAKLIANDNEIRAAIRLLELQIAQEEARLHRSREQRTTTAVIDGTVPDPVPAKKTAAASRNKRRSEVVSDQAAILLAGTSATPLREQKSGASAPATGKVEDQRKLIEQFQTIKDAGRERRERVPNGVVRQTGQEGKASAASPPKRLDSQTAISHTSPGPKNAEVSPVSSPESPIVTALSEAARQSPNSQKQGRLAEWALRHSNREDKPWERPRLEYLRELARQVQSRGEEALYDPNTDADIAVRMRIAGFTWNQISKTLVTASPIATSLSLPEHQSVYLEKMIKPFLQSSAVRQRHEDMRRWRLQQDSPERQGEYRLDRLGLATTTPQRSAAPQKNRDIEPER